MNNTNIRRASLGDLDRVAVLFDAYRQFYAMQPDVGLAESYLRARIATGESVILVAESEAVGIVGFCQLYPTFCSVFAGRIYVLNDLFVQADLRGTGVGKALLQAAERHAAENGAIRMELRTARDNARAQTLYESSGWKRSTLFYAYSKRLPGSCE